jgi:hypothetical protein
MDYATYVQILTSFFDTLSPGASFSVHRMALGRYSMLSTPTSPPRAPLALSPLQQQFSTSSADSSVSYSTASTVSLEASILRRSPPLPPPSSHSPGGR